ncbi:hypothetical protein FKM82_030130 [Ascaphus truei]
MLYCMPMRYLSMLTLMLMKIKLYVSRYTNYVICVIHFIARLVLLPWAVVTIKNITGIELMKPLWIKIIQLRAPVTQDTFVIYSL